jgi:F0F1-type ATP synthase assembly protein I
MNPPILEILPSSELRSLHCTVRKLLSLQLAAAISSSALLGLWFGPSSATAVVWGSTAAAANAMLLIWRWHRGAQAMHSDAQRHLRSFYTSSLERIVVVGALFAAGMGPLHLNALPMISGFILAQLGMFVVQFLPAAKSYQNV